MPQFQSPEPSQSSTLFSDRGSPRCNRLHPGCKDTGCKDTGCKGTPPQRLLPTLLGLALPLLTLPWLSLPASANSPTPTRPNPSSPLSRPSTAPNELVQLLKGFDDAASSQNLTQTLARYSDQFKHSDGLDRRSLETALRSFWKDYSNLNYRTEIKDWQAIPQGWQVETITHITGIQALDQRQLTLKSTLRSRQTIVNGKLVSQEILAERNQINSGAKPPELDIRIPEQVGSGQSYNLDVIVTEPLGNDLLMGGLLDEPVSLTRFPDPTKVDLEPLLDLKTGTGPGGFFKVGQAAKKPENRWISAVVLRRGGLTMVTQRLRVTDGRR